MAAASAGQGLPGAANPASNGQLVPAQGLAVPAPSPRVRGKMCASWSPPCRVQQGLVPHSKVVYDGAGQVAVKYAVNNFRIRSENAEVAAKLVCLPLIATIYHSLLSDI